MHPEGTPHPAGEGCTVCPFPGEAKTHTLPLFRSCSVYRTQHGREGGTDPAFLLRTVWLTW